MRRTDRLHALIARFGDGQLHTAEDLAGDLGVSQRTLYRDVEVLRASGLSIEGTRGAGYRMTERLALPPLDLSLPELEALQLGLAVVSEAADPELRDAARSLGEKIDALLPAEGQAPPSAWSLAAYPLAEAGGGVRHLPTLRAAIRARQKLRMTETGAAHPRTLRPLALDYRGRAWWLIAWCEDRRAFASLRTGRIASLEILPELFVEEPGRTLADYHGAAARAPHSS